MGDHAISPTCLSSTEHAEDDILDCILHYFGCLREEEKEKYLRQCTHSERNRIDAEKARIKSLKKSFESLHPTDKSDERRVFQNLQDSLENWRNPGNKENETENHKESKKLCGEYGSQDQNEQQPSEKASDEVEIDKDINAYVIHFKVDGKNKSSSQSISVLELLQEGTGLLSPSKPPKFYQLRYFHLPANNMFWAEEAIARYFNVKRPKNNELFYGGKKRESIPILLSPEYWRGQMHGGRRDPITARYMRPQCKRVPSNLQTPREMDKDVVFMLYLHWDTDRKREQFARIIEHETSRHLWIKRKDYAKKEKLRKDRTWAKDFNTRLSNMPDFDDMIVLMRKDLRENKRGPALDKHRRVLTTSKIGQLLFDAAMLYEAMNNFRDKKLVQKYLHFEKVPSLHPRRTLDQAYYTTLYTTKHRDRDQVVYRGTTAILKDLHKFDSEKQTWPCDRDVVTSKCNECKLHARKLSRVVMVDQLWMWVLDANTVMTFFPKRYGFNKQDPSGVYNRIRGRCERARPDEIVSVFDMALIILDECSSTFFDRTKTFDRQPQVLDIFADSIARMANKSTISFKNLLQWTEEVSKYHNSTSKTPKSLLHPAILDINLEGRLQRDIRDLEEELSIMIQIEKQQQKVIKCFIENAKHILKNMDSFRDTERGSESQPDIPGQEKKPESQSPYTNSSQKISSQPSESRKRGDNVKGSTSHEYQCFERNAEELLSKIADYITELENLQQSARITSTNGGELLSLKQQQASVVQAWESAKQGGETVIQGKSIMFFTVVTIIFLPLSFMSSIFGMNAIEFGAGGNWTLAEQFKYMFPVSAGVIVITLFFAFSSYLRSIARSVFESIFINVMVHGRIYKGWLFVQEKELDEKGIIKRTERRVRDMKDMIRKAKSERGQKRYGRAWKNEGGSGSEDGEVRSSVSVEQPESNNTGSSVFGKLCGLSTSKQPFDGCIC